MQGKIGLEEHFAINETLMDSAGFVPDDHWPELRSRDPRYSRAPAAPDGSARHGDDAPVPQRAGRASDTRTRKKRTKLHAARMTF